MPERALSQQSERVRCARDSDWCDGLVCHAWGGCPNADPDTHIEGLKSTCERRPGCGCSIECKDYLARLRTDAKTGKQPTDG
jgi:hypothetical protein